MGINLHAEVYDRESGGKNVSVREQYKTKGQRGLYFLIILFKVADS